MFRVETSLAGGLDLLIRPQTTSAYSPILLTLLPTKRDTQCRLAILSADKLGIETNVANLGMEKSNRLVLGRAVGQSILVDPCGDLPLTVQLQEQTERGAKMSFHAHQSVKIWRAELGLKRKRHALVSQLIDWFTEHASDNVLLQECIDYRTAEQLTSQRTANSSRRRVYEVA